MVKITSLKQDTYSRVLGLDCSTNSVGYSYLVDGELKSYGEVFFKGSSVFKRLRDAKREIREQLSDLDVDVIVFESAVFIQNKQTVINLAYAFGAVVSELMEVFDCDVNDIPPITWQNAIGNKALTKAEKQAIKDDAPGKSESWYKNQYREFRKQRTKDWVNNKYGTEIESDNITDAVALSSVFWDKQSH